MNNTQILTPGSPAFGGLSQGLINFGGDIQRMRSLVPLPEDAQKLIDTAVVRVGRDRLAVVDDLLNEGLVFNLPNWFAVPTIVHQEESEAGGARRSMVISTQGESQLADRDSVTTPVYATMDDFFLDARTLATSQRAGAPLDVSLVEKAVRKVNEAIEDAAINGGPTVDGNATFGLINAPSANTFTYAGSEAWDAAGHTGEEILQDVLGMVDTLEADRMFGPYNLYIPTEYGNKLNEDFKANSDKTIRQRLEELTFGGRNLRIRTADLLPDDRTALVQMTSDVIDVIVGQVPAALSWPSANGLDRFNLILSCVVPRPKRSYTNQSGICIGNV